MGLCVASTVYTQSRAFDYAAGAGVGWWGTLARSMSLKGPLYYLVIVVVALFTRCCMNRDEAAFGARCEVVEVCIG